MILLALLATVAIDTTNSNQINFGGATNSISATVSDAGANELVLVLADVNVGTIANLSAPTCSGASLTWTLVVSQINSDTGAMAWACTAYAASQLSAVTITAGWTGDNTSAADIVVVTFTGAATAAGASHANRSGGTLAGASLTISNAITTTGSASYVYFIGQDYDDGWDTNISTVDGSSTVVYGGASGASLVGAASFALGWAQRTTSTISAQSITLSRTGTGKNATTTNHLPSVTIEIPTLVVSTGLPPGVSRSKGGEGR